MDSALVLPLTACTDVALAGGKAVGLARLITAGFPVPPGLCLTTAAYRQALLSIRFPEQDRWEAAQRLSGDARRESLADCQRTIRNISIAESSHAVLEQLQQLNISEGTTWAVRSSATNEDAARASFAGVYRTVLGISLDHIDQAITDVWSSIWDERVVAYHEQSKLLRHPPAMAVVFQPMLSPRVAGVAHSVDPMNGRPDRVIVDAVPGLAQSLGDGTMTPDHYVVTQDAASDRYRMLSKALRKPSASISDPQLEEHELMELVRSVKQIERTFAHPVDVEWAIDNQGLWLLQARPITTPRQSAQLTNDDCEWSRTNFKETMPEVPSPMGLSFLQHFMEVYVLSHYRRLGCRIPSGLSSVRVLHGRPYLNVSLFYDLVGQLRGDPTLNIEQMGGAVLLNPPPVKPLGWFAYIRAGWLMLREMNRVAKSGPRWFVEMKQLAATYHLDRIRDYSRQELASHLDQLGRWLDGRELTFGIAGGVGQCLQALSLLLPGWLGEEWRSLLNAALQGQGNVISAQQIVRLADVVELARRGETVSRTLLGKGLNYEVCVARLKGSAFLAAFHEYIMDYGHRGLGESDVMSPRWSDRPEALLDVIRAQLRGPASRPKDIFARQRDRRHEAMAAIRARCGWRLDRWIIFQWWYRRLCRFSALREENRHHLMYYSRAARNLLLRLGERLAEGDLLSSREDIFFLTMAEREQVSAGSDRDWKPVVRDRKAERERWLTLTVPDTIRNWEDASSAAGSPPGAPAEGVLRGIPISPGSVNGSVRHVRSIADWANVAVGDIIVAPVIDPGMAPLFGIAAGLIVEMGGTLSHGAIIAREYGLPAVANVTDAMSLLKEGDRIRLDASRGILYQDGEEPT